MADSISILVLGAGELGMAVLRGLAGRAARSRGTSLTVLLRPSTIGSPDPVKQRDIAELRSLGVEFLPGDSRRRLSPPTFPLCSGTSTL